MGEYILNTSSDQQRDPEKKNRQKEETLKYTACLQYMSGLSEGLRRVAEQCSPQSPHLEGNSPELPVNLILSRTTVVYRVSFTAMERNIIEETKRALKSCIKRTTGSYRRGETDKSTVAEHAWAEQHHPVWNEASVMEKAKNVDILWIKGTVCITLVTKQQLHTGVQPFQTVRNCSYGKNNNIATHPSSEYQQKQNS